MTITERRSNDALVLTLTGSLDGFSASEVERELLRRVEAGETRLVIDLSGTDYISSVGLGTLILVHKRAQAKGGRACFCGLNEALRQVFEFSGLFLLLDVQTDCDAALASLATA
jgi:anti-anti-sigma factor